MPDVLPFHDAITSRRSYRMLAAWEQSETPVPFRGGEQRPETFMPIAVPLSFQAQCRPLPQQGTLSFNPGILGAVVLPALRTDCNELQTFLQQIQERCHPCSDPTMRMELVNLVLWDLPQGV